MRQWCFRERETEIDIKSDEHLKQVLLELPRRVDPNVEILHPNGDFLSVSARECFYFVMCTQRSLQPPYLAATWPQSGDENGPEFDFLVADTPTPVPLRQCLPREVALRVCVDYLQTGSLPTWLQWESV